MLNSNIYRFHTVSLAWKRAYNSLLTENYVLYIDSSSDKANKIVKFISTVIFTDLLIATCSKLLSGCGLVTCHYFHYALLLVYFIFSGHLLLDAFFVRLSKRVHW